MTAKPVSYASPAAVTLPLRDWLNVIVALRDAAEKNQQEGYPNAAARCLELAGRVHEQTIMLRAQAQLRRAEQR
jgi:hypothetical protein